MSFVKIWLHCVWTTQYRNPILKKEFRKLLFDHIRSNAQEKGIYIDHINGEKEHVHCLISMNAEQNISKVMMLIKGESSFWFNKQAFCKDKLVWQDDYFAVSIGESAIPAVRKYIQNQEEHHRLKSFQEEYEEFIEKYGFTRIMG